MITLYGATIAAQYDSQNIPVDGTVSVTPICVLPDCILCNVREEINSPYELEMQYVATGVNASEILVDRILGAKVPLNNSIEENLFRIYRVERDLTGRIYVYARHIASDLSYIPVRNNTQGTGIRIINVDSWQILLREYATNAFPFWIIDESSATPPGDVYRMKFKTVASAAAYLGGEELVDPDKTLLQIFGGEFVWDNFTIRRYDMRGTTRNYVINYGENIDGLGIDDDLDGVYTSFILFYNGEEIQVASDVASTSYASLFPYARTQMIDWTEFIPETMTAQAAIEAELNRAAPIYAQNHQELGNPVRKIEVDVVSAGIDEIFLGDFVPVRYVRHGVMVNANMRVVSYEWDVIMQRYNRVTLGAVKTSLAKVIAESAQTGNAVKQVNSRVASIATEVTAQETALASLTQRMSAAETIITTLDAYRHIVNRGTVTNCNIGSLSANTMYYYDHAAGATNSPSSADSGSGILFMQNAANYGIQVEMTASTGVWIRVLESGYWRAWQRLYSTTASLPIFKTQQFDKVISLNAGANISLSANDMGLTTPTGYSCVGCAGFWGGDISFLVSEVNALATGTQMAMRIKNTYTNALNNKTANIKLLYIKNPGF